MDKTIKESIWESTVQLPEFESLNSNKKTDVLIIGGGIAGILTAYFCHINGIDYILAEKDRICSENTKNTTAKITYQHGLVYEKIANSYGVEGAKQYFSVNKAAFGQYAALCEKIKCDYEIKDNYVYSLNDRAKLEAEMKILEKIGCDAEFCENPPLPLKTVGAVKVPFQAQFHPLKFIKEICNGLNIFEHTHIQSVKGNKAFTDLFTVEAQRIVFATHFPFIDLYGFYPLKLYQHRSYVLALENAAQVDGMYVDESDNGLSFRNYGKYLLLGGGDHRTGKKGGNWDELRNFAYRSYPFATEKYSWSAQDCMSLDSIPYIGRYSPSKPNWYVMTGFNKWGMTGAMVAAMLVCDIITGQERLDAEIFTPSRSILHKQLFINAAETVVNMLSLTPKRCSHLGCALKWNKSEHSWDCACHGSRFTQDGKVINNPANKNIKM